jgi:TnpA family transposase
MRDSLHVLDVILNRDGGPAPQMIATDTASYSDIVFGLFRLLGCQFSQRLADIPTSGSGASPCPVSGRLTMAP